MLRTNFELRCSPSLSTLPSRRPCRCSSRLPPAPCCASRRSRSARYFYTSLGWRCPHSSHSSGCCCSMARPAGLHSRISETGTEVEGSQSPWRQTSGRGFGFSVLQQNGRRPYSTRFCHCHQYGEAFTTSWSSPAIRNRSVPEPRSKTALSLPISSHSPGNS